MDSAKKMIAIVLMVGCIYVLFRSWGISNHQQELKQDLALINDARYGLFNVETWKNELKSILVSEVAKFELNGDNREVVKQQLEGMLHTLVDEVQQSLNDLQGFDRIKGMLANIVINYDRIRSDIPDYAEAILQDLESQENMESLRSNVLANIDQWILVSDTTQLITPQTVTLQRYGHTDVAACSAELRADIRFMREQLWLYTALAMVFAFLAYMAMVLTDSGRTPLYILSCISIILLAGGLSLPMLDLQAGMEDIGFTIMGNTISFEQQVLFYQSKSILDVVVTLFRSGTFNGILVGFLILLFSVLFPVSKLVASLAYLLSTHQLKSPIANFLVFKSGKWSMADVFVVAVFMAFLGFSGLIDSQLANLPQTEHFRSVAFNGSAFQPGFLWFTAFCISGLFLSVMIGRQSELLGQET